MKLPPETRHALSLQELRAFVQPAFVFDENVPVKIPVQTPRRQAKTGLAPNFAHNLLRN